VRTFAFGAVVFALTAAGCISAESWEAVRVLKDVIARGEPSDLKAMTPPPSRSEVRFAVEGRAHLADLYHPNQPIGAKLVLIPGFTQYGKDDARLVDLATSLSRARFMVLVPNLTGSREIRVALPAESPPSHPKVTRRKKLVSSRLCAWVVKYPRFRWIPIHGEHRPGRPHCVSGE